MKSKFWKTVKTKKNHKIHHEKPCLNLIEALFKNRFLKLLSGS